MQPASQQTVNYSRNAVMIIILTIGVFVCPAQTRFSDSIAHARNDLTRNAMITLGSWAAANIAKGLLIAAHTSGEAKYAWRMNAYWNVFNLGLAGLGYAGLHRASRQQLHFSGNLKAQQAMEKLYAFNAGLDLAYIAGGFYLREKGRSSSDPSKKNQFRGYGTSIVIQGAFLLGMDAVMFSLHHKNTGRMQSRLEQWEIHSGGDGLGVALIF